MAEPMAKWVGWAASAGFTVAIFWFVMAFVLFTAEPQGPWWGLYFFTLFITCPAWFVPVGPAVPFVNAGIYALVAFAAFKLRESGRAYQGRSEPS